ncbi:hypothetical protein M8J77_019570 [Diaphorina citri]|nr:hypothetical protein M8J77_019570 [Diaphorina citri]
MSTPAPSSESVCIEHSNLFPKCHSCQKCEESFGNCNNLWSHMFIKHENSDFVCNLCGDPCFNRVKYAPLLLRHMKEEHYFRLDIPDAISRLRYRVQVVSQDESVQFRCPECSVQFSDFQALRGHLFSHSDERMYACEECGKSFKTKIQLCAHKELVHEGKQRSVCDTCGRTYKTKHSLNQHMKIHSDVRGCMMVWTCCKCVAKYTSRSHLSLHLLSHSSDADSDDDHELHICSLCRGLKDSHFIYVALDSALYCAHCDQVFTDKNILELHIKIEHDKRNVSLFVCLVCGCRLFRRKNDLRKHMQDVHSVYHMDSDLCAVSRLQDITFPCEECKELCVLSKYCIKHKDCSKAMSTPAPSSESVCIEHSNLIPKCHSCQKCEESFDNCNNLWSHMFIKHENSDFVCNLCPPDSKVVIKYVHLLVRHMKKHHTMQLRISSVSKHIKSKTQIFVDGAIHFKCTDCPTIFTSFNGLKNHLDIHSGEKDYACHICNKVFVRHSTLENHTKAVHEKIREFQCKVCGRAFFDVSNMKQHMRIHTGEKKYVCETCGASFVHRGSIIVHNYSHINAQFVCSYCGNIYKNPRALEGHIRNVHTNPQKNICDVCGKEFKMKKLLKEHMAVHTTDRPFVCEFCPSAFKLNKHLRQHYKVHLK